MPQAEQLRDGEEIVREDLKNKKRIVVKIGSSSLHHLETGELNLLKIERLIRILTDLHSQGKEVILVSSGAIAVGRRVMERKNRPETVAQKQALAAIGQARLMMVYQKLFMEYNQKTAQVLLTKYSVMNSMNRINARNTFSELFKMDIIPVVNENDTVATNEIEFGDNDHLSAFVTALVDADLLILLSDIDGMYTDDPHRNPDATLISEIPEITAEYVRMGKNTSGSGVGTGGMAAKVDAARIATDAGADVVIANGEDVQNIMRVMDGEPIGTLFVAHRKSYFDFMHYISSQQ